MITLMTIAKTSFCSVQKAMVNHFRISQEKHTDRWDKVTVDRMLVNNLLRSDDTQHTMEEEQRTEYLQNTVQYYLSKSEMARLLLWKCSYI